jgi:hypothetical protein
MFKVHVQPCYKVLKIRNMCVQLGFTRDVGRFQADSLGGVPNSRAYDVEK